MALESDAPYSRQGGPYSRCGTVDGVKHLVLRSGSGNGVSQCLSMYCKSVMSGAKGDRTLAVTEIGGEGSEWLNCRLAIEPTGDLGTVSSSYLR